MESENWRLSAKLCDSCKTTSASVFCRADSAFLCLSCDSKIHAANKLASRHGRVWVCEVCEQAPATVTCKADSAALCVTCDRDIHSANPLARRHERIPVVPFYDSALAKSNGAADDNDNDNDDDDDKYFNGEDAVEAAEELEAEAASWILPTPGNNNNNNTIEMNDDVAPARYKSENYLFNDMDSYLDFDIMSYDQKPNIMQLEQQNYNSDGVVPTVQNNKNEIICSHFQQGQVVDGFPTYEMDFSGSKPYLYNFSSQSISQSVSSSSLDVGIVPDHSAIADVSNTFETNPSADAVPTPLSGVDREARVMRYREKRKNRKFEKTIRYASRKAYAETRPRIKGRFAKRTELDIDSLLNVDASYGVVPSF